MNTVHALQDSRSYRLQNIDMLRGLVIVIMAIDHVRDFFMVGMLLDPLAQPDVSTGLYLTRWVTHFCAPVFVLLAGTSAGLMAARKSKGELGAFLLKRGLWLILVEAALISTSATFSPFAGIAQLGGAHMIIAQVLWAIGASMVILAGVQFLGARACLVIGALILLGHNGLDNIWPAGNLFAGDNPLWYALHSQSSTSAGPFILIFIYPLLPWTGVMLLGYGSAFIFEKSPPQRDTFLLRAGLLMMATFLVIRASGLYGDPNPWQAQPAGILASAFDFMNVTKYPPSMLFLLATLGPMSILCAFADHFRGWLKDALVMFGRVPFAFYVTHFYLIHLLCMALGKYQGFEFSQMATIFFFFPQGYGISLAGVYVVWLLVLAILYPFCKWVARLKASRKDWWLSYL